VSLTWLSSLYAPAKDIAKGVMGLRLRGVMVTIEAHAQGLQTWIIVTAQCRPDGKPVVVRGCWAELYETAIGTCIDPQPVRTRVINFRPGGPVTIQPGELPVRWEANVLNEHVRRAVRRLDDAATIRALGEQRGHEILALHDCPRHDRKAHHERHPMIGMLAQLLGDPSGEMVRVRAVLEPVHGKSLVTKDVRIPPLAPFNQRLELFGTYLAARRSKSKVATP
jgi:hypothetical protein